jgi:carboxymethylenebutenolidase
MPMRTPALLTLAALVATAGWSSAQVVDEHAGHAMHSEAPAAVSLAQAGSASLPPGEEGAKARLNASPRHGEYATVALPGGGNLRAWVSYPERKDKAPVVIVIHEIFGLTDWIRSVADQLAADGYIAVAPDLLTGKGPGGGGTEAYASRDDVVAGVRGLTPDEVVTRLDAVRAFGAALPASNGKTATVGYCWGGSTSFTYATRQPGLDAAVVYYGGSPTEASALAAIKAPVLGLYGEDDARVNATVPPAEAEMKKLGKVFETHTYAGAGHGFLRAQSGREGANLKATEQAWPAMLAFFKQHLR